MEKYREVEKSIIKRYRKTIWSRFVKAIKEYELIQEGDKIAVCISGGKDSFILAKCMQELKRHGQFDFDVEFIVMNPGYKQENIDLIYENSKMLNIPVHVFESDIFDVVYKMDKNPCYMCARMRRGFLYKKARELGCNKIALGHHYDDVIETILLSIFFSGEFKTMMPKLHSTNHPGMELIRPLYFIREKDIITWQNYNELKFLNCACRFTEECEFDEEKSKRLFIKKLINSLSKESKYIEGNIFKSVEKVNLETVLSYIDNGEVIDFLEKY